MIDPKQTDIGRAVSCVGHFSGEREYGRITSFNEHYVFVKYNGDEHSKATHRQHLEWQ